MAKLDGHLGSITPNTGIYPGDVLRVVSEEDGAPVASTFSDCIVTKIEETKSGLTLTLARPHAMVSLISTICPTVYTSVETFSVEMSRLPGNFMRVLNARGETMNVGRG